MLISELKDYLLKEFKDNKYTIGPEYLKKYITDSDKSYSISIDNLYLTVLYKSKECENILNMRIVKTLKRVSKILKTLKNNKKYKIWFIPTLSKREFPEENKIVDTKNINGGYTYVGLGHNANDELNIFIYRFEEFSKVLLHEVLHHSKYHAHEWEDKKIYEIFKINKKLDLRPNEAVVETWTLILNLKAISKEIGISYKFLLDSEKQWAYIQAKKIIDIHNNRKLFIDGLWYENTHSYCYIVFRAIFLFKIKEFMKLIYPYDKNEITKLLIKNKDEFFAYLNKNIILENTNKINSMRMTLFGDL